MADLTVVAANLYNSKAAVRYLRQRSRADHPDHYTAAIVSEAHKRRRMLRRSPGHDYHTGPTRGASQEVGILYDAALPLRGIGSEFQSSAAGRFASVGKERWGHDIVTHIANTDIAVIGGHPVGGPKMLADPDRDPLDRRYEQFADWLAARIAYHEALDREWVFGGDIQLRENTDVPWNPRHIFAERNARWLWHGIDVVAWSPGLVRVGNLARSVREHVLPDHPMLVVELNVNQTKRRKKP